MSQKKTLFIVVADEKSVEQLSMNGSNRVCVCVCDISVDVFHGNKIAVFIIKSNHLSDCILKLT